VNLDRLRTFRALAETLHVRRTAVRLHLSQSAVSQQIAALEEELGVPLLERIGRRVFLTPAGRVLAEEAARVLAAMDRAIEAVRAHGSDEVGLLRLGASTTPGVYLVPQALGSLRTSLPAVEVSFRIANSSAIERALLDNELDLGIVGEEIAHEELFQIALGDDRIVAVVAPSLAPGRPRRHVRPADLGTWPLLAREAGSATQKYVDAALSRAGARTAPAFELPSPEAQVRAAAAGLGIAFVSRHVAAHDLSAGRLVEIAIRGMRLVRPIEAAYHRDKRVTPAMKRVMELVRRAARGR
jgi:DNA-binding transcriptional LysR family regulator